MTQERVTSPGAAMPGPADPGSRGGVGGARPKLLLRLHRLAQVTSSFAEEVEAALAAAGVERAPAQAAACPGVLVAVDGVSGDLLHLVHELSAGGRERLIITMPVAQLGTQQVWALLQAGAADCIAWADAGTATEIAGRLRCWQEVDRIVASPLVRSNLVGESPAWRSMLRDVVEAAISSRLPVLVTGETGTGKELVARLIHTLDRHARKRDVVVVDCTIIVPELAGSELFGHERGAFTGASAPRQGAVALADGGTLFLDEVGELPQPLQAQLLRVIQEHVYKPVGGNTWRETRFRLVSATNVDLLAAVEQGLFRRDLYYRIAGIVVHLPPLRERQEDILPLARHFIAMHMAQSAQTMRAAHGSQPSPTSSAMEVPELDPAVEAVLLERSYPGNVRDLQQLIARLMQRHTGGRRITPGDLPESDRPSHEAPGDWRDAGFRAAIRRALLQGVGLREITQATSEVAVALAVADEEGSLQRAAKRLGVTDRALQMRRAARAQQRAAASLKTER